MNIKHVSLSFTSLFCPHLEVVKTRNNNSEKQSDSGNQFLQLESRKK